MNLSPGLKFGPYELIAQIGAGGMGEVWKAKDTRLDRLVAIKVLPDHLTSQADSLARFEREAKAVAALNHPNILSIFDIGTQDGTSYAVMELLEGESLRARLATGPLTPRKATELAIQMASGLAAAHEKGVIHRDLKPENVWITKDGRLKVLDFGLAKQAHSWPSGAGSQVPTQSLEVGASLHTGEGMILGTVGYMSPEQVRGELVDARSDIFSFGVVLYEMLTGRKAFARATTADTMAAILKEDPPERVEDSTHPLPLSLSRVLDHCLEKSPSGRFQSAHDLAYALEAAAAPSATESGSAVSHPPTGTSHARWVRWAALGVAIPSLLIGGWMARGSTASPTFRRLTYGKGTVDAARFAPNSQEVIFSARWNGAAPEIFSLNPSSREPRSLGITGATLVAVSPTGELAVKQNPRLWASLELGALARVTPGGGTRTVLDGVVDADWMPGGTELATLRGSAVSRRPTSDTEFPPGHPVQGLANYDWGLRVSPNGLRMACLDQSGVTHGDGKIVVVDREGRVKAIAEVKGFTGLAWGPHGNEIWYSETLNGTTALWALSLEGRKRLLLRQAGMLELLDVSEDGRALASLGMVIRGTMGMRAPEYREKDLSWNEATNTMDITPDGKRLLLGNELWDTEGNHHTLYVMDAGGSLPVRIGEGMDAGFMPSGTEVYTLPLLESNKVVLLPVGAGQPREVQIRGGEMDSSVSVFPDGKRALVQAGKFGFLIVQLADGRSEPLKGIDTEAFSFTRFLGDQPISPLGDTVILTDTSHKVLDGTMYLVHMDGSAPTPVKGTTPGDIPMRWAEDGKSIFVFNRDGLPTRIHRIELVSGKRTLVREIMPTNPAGLAGIRTIEMTPDTKVLAYNYVRKLSDLYLIEGLK